MNKLLKNEEKEQLGVSVDGEWSLQFNRRGTEILCDLPKVFNLSSKHCNK